MYQASYLTKQSGSVREGHLDKTTYSKAMNKPSEFSEQMKIVMWLQHELVEGMGWGRDYKLGLDQGRTKPFPASGKAAEL